MTLLYVGNLGSVHIQRWLRFFVAQGHEVHLLTPPVDGISAPGIHVHVWHSIRTRLRPLDYAANTALLAPRVLQFRALVRRIRPDLVHAHYLNDAAFIAALAGARPLVVTAWGSDVLINPRRSTLLRVMVSAILRKANLVTCDAAHVQRALIADAGAQPGEIRPSADTHTISVITRPAPPSALPPRCTRWKSDGVPSSAEYMSIAETITRLTSSSSRSLKGWNMGGTTSPGPMPRRLV